MKSPSLLPLSFPLLLSMSLPACGDDQGGGADASIDGSMADSGPIRRLNVQIDMTTVCPEGWSEGPTATEQPNLIEITASCADGAGMALMQFAPKPGAGESAPCTQVTLQGEGGARVNCRVNNQVLNDPEGMLTLSEGQVGGECGCTGDEQDGASEGGASFQLPLE